MKPNNGKILKRVKRIAKAATPSGVQTVGSTLIGLVVAILIFSVLAAAIVPMISSSSHQTGAANMASKAFLLAESGFRYAAGKYLHAGPSEKSKNNTLEQLDGNYTLSDNDSRFELKLFSYFYETVSDISNGDTSFKAHTPGSFPDGVLPDGDVFLDPGLQIQLEDQIYTLTPGSQGVVGEDDNVTMAVNPSLAFYPAGTLAYPVADADDARTPSISHGGNVAYQNGQGRMFPMRNGRIRVNGRILTYGFNDRTNNRFVDVRDPEDHSMVAHPIPPGTKIILTKFTRVQSTGIYGTGSMQARKQVTYHVPLPLADLSTQRKEFADRFDTKSDWTDSPGTLTTIGDVGGDSALRVDSTASSGSNLGSLTAFTPTTDAAKEIDFSASSRGGRGYLSYDVQAKFGFENTPTPPMGFDPPGSSIPKYFAAGISFRLSSADAGLFGSNGYGISFLRGFFGEADRIPDDFVPIADSKVIVLWQQTGNGANRTWLAYKEMADLTFDEDNENSLDDQFGAEGPNNFWHPEGSSGRQRSGSTRNWYYGRSVTNNYELGAAPNSGYIQSGLILLPAGYTKHTLNFWSWHETEPQRAGFNLNDFDRKEVIILNSSGIELDKYTIGTSAAPGAWYQPPAIDLSAYAGQVIRIRFNFDTVDGSNNDYEGWYVDDVRIVSEWPVQNSTLAVNLQEALVLRITNGTPQIRKGDRIYGHLRGTIGTVITEPILSSGDWSGSAPAQGILLLNRISTTTTAEEFLPGEQLTVIGRTGRAEVVSFDQTDDLKANVIKVYFASQNGIGTANTDPVDANAAGYSRLSGSDTLQWPPHVDAAGDWTDDDGNFTSAEDVFRLIQWDAINPAAVPIDVQTNDQGLIVDAIVQNHHNDLQSPAFPGILTEAEIGLHAIGDGALNAYFDDFGIRLDVSLNDTVPPPLQQ